MMKYTLKPLAILLLTPFVVGGRIDLQVSLPNGDAAEGIRVDCYDHDPLHSDEYMGGGHVGSSGSISINYPTTSTSWWSCGSWWDACANTSPDIYCEVGESGDCVTPVTPSTQESQDQFGTTTFQVTVQPNENFCTSNWNGCGPYWIPDWLTEIFDDVSGFQSSCIEHDACYSNCNESRAACDDAFYTDMNAKCDEQDEGSSCEVLSNIFYKAVVVGGESSYNCP